MKEAVVSRDEMESLSHPLKPNGGVEEERVEEEEEEREEI